MPEWAKKWAKSVTKEDLIGLECQLTETPPAKASKNGMFVVEILNFITDGKKETPRFSRVLCTQQDIDDMLELQKFTFYIPEGEKYARAKLYEGA